VKSSFKCPVCTSSKWEKLEQYNILHSNHVTVDKKWKQLAEFLPSVLRILALCRPARQPICKRHISGSQFRRRSAYFDIWKGPATLDSIKCRKCGFLCYTPRPTAEELESTCVFFEENDPFFEGPYDPAAEAKKRDHQRSERVYTAVAPFLSGKYVLDFGGANGILLTAFKERGMQCFLADYSDRQLPGIKKIANSLNDLKGTYDCILLSHVLEHAAEPGELLAGLRNHLNNQGLLYVEVPIEILAGIPRLERDPVPHVNFFTDGTLKTILRMNGYKIISAFRGWSSYGNIIAYVTWAVATKGYEQPTFEPHITDALLYPSRSYVIERLWPIIRRQAKEI